MAISIFYERKLAWSDGFDSNEQSRDERPQVCQTAGSCRKHDDGNGKRNNVLLKSEISIHGYEYIEFLRCERQQFAICDRGPAPLTGGTDIVTGDFPGEAPIEAFVKKDSHDVVSMRRSFASCKNSITCFLVTVGSLRENRQSIHLPPGSQAGFVPAPLCRGTLRPLP